MRPCVRIATGDAAKADAIETLPELLDFGTLDELDDFTDELLDFTELLLDCDTLDDEEFATLDEEDFTELLDCGTLDEDTSFALEELETLEELELLGAVIAASTLSINSSETLLFSTGYLSLSDCVQAEPSKP